MQTVTVVQLIRKLRSSDNDAVLKAVDELRAHGWLYDGALESVRLQHAHLQRADLQGADLQRVDLHMADLRGANLSMANLQRARLSAANLHRADFQGADLQGADLRKANLQGARNVSDEQLAQIRQLRGATMPDGSPYDGRFHLVGDMQAMCFLGVDTNNPAAVAEFYGIFLEDYEHGQKWAREHLSDNLGETVKYDPCAETGFVLAYLDELEAELLEQLKTQWQAMLERI